MFRFRSLQSRITALYSATFGLVMLLVAASLQWAIASSAEQQVRSELASSSKVIDRIWTMRARELESVARPLALPDAIGRPLAVELLEDEGVVRRGAVEGDLHPGHLAPAGALLLGVAHAQERRDDQREIVDAASGACRAGAQLG